MNVADQGAGRDRHHVVPRTLIEGQSLTAAPGNRLGSDKLIALSLIHI